MASVLLAFIIAKASFVNPIFSENQIVVTNNKYNCIYKIAEKGVGNSPRRSGIGVYPAKGGASLQHAYSLLSAPGCGRWLTVSPDGKWIGCKLIKADGQIPVVINLRTLELKKLCKPAPFVGQPSFSADGERAYTLGKNLIFRGKKIWLGWYANLAPISPDGENIAFNDDKDRIWTMNTDGKDKQCITRDGCFNPRWSPDSKKLLVSTLSGSLMVVDLQTDDTYTFGKGKGGAWAPDSKYIVYYITSDDGHELTGSDLFIIKWDGTEKTQLTYTQDVFEQHPAFSSNGELIAFDTYTRGEIWIAEFKKMQLQNLKKVAGPTELPELNYLYKPGKGLDAPYIHQVYDTPDWFNGNWACGPTSAMMVIQYYGILPNWDCTCSWPYEHISHWGRYICEEYTYNGYTYSDTARDPSSNLARGGYGYMWYDGYSPHSRMAQYLIKHGLDSWTDDSPTWTELTSETDQGHPGALCCGLTGAGHLIVVVGYIGGQHTIIANDPYGDKNTSGYPSYDGKNAQYDWPGYNNGYENLNNIYWAAGARGTPLSPGIVVDDQDSGFEKFGTPGYWHDASYGYKGHMYWTYTNGDTIDNRAKWTPELQDSGIYRVHVFIPDHYATTKHAVYEVKHKNGANHILVDQSSFWNTWVVLGSYPYDSSQGEVNLTDATGESSKYIGFDAVRWLWLANSYTWEFNSAFEPAEDWTTGNDISDFYAQDGVLYMKVTGSDPYIYSPWLSYEGSNYKCVELCMKVEQGSPVQLSFITTDDLSWDEAKSETLAISNHLDYVIYKFDLSGNAGWINHTISRLRLDPTAGVESTGVYLDYIKVVPLFYVEEESNCKLQIRNCKLEVYPNPFTAGVRFQISDTRYQNPDIRHPTSDLSLKIYDLSGRLVKTLIPNPLSLTTAVEWDTREISAGVYFVKLRTGNHEITKKLIALK